MYPDGLMNVNIYLLVKFVLGPDNPAPAIPDIGEEFYLVYICNCFTCSRTLTQILLALIIINKDLFLVSKQMLNLRL